MFSAPFAAAPRAKQFAGAYQQVGLQTSVPDASPHQLIVMLFDGLFGALHRAQTALTAGDFATKSQAIAHAVRIVDEGLKAGLDVASGGKLATDLNDLYAYVCLRLTQANLHHDGRALDECIALMQPLREAWTAIGRRPAAATSN